MHRKIKAGVVSFLILSLARLCAASLDLGANFNEHLTAAEVTALDATGVRWIRGFLPAGEFLDVTRVPAETEGARPNRRRASEIKRRELATDPGVAVFRAAAASGRKLAITLKWDFKRTHWRVPAPDSDDERKAFAWSVDVVRELRPDMLLLVNEIFIDTANADLEAGADGVIPMVRFLQRLAAHVHAAGLRTPSGAPLAVSCGGFTRLDRTKHQKHPVTQAMLPWLASSPHLTHVNFHLHQHDLAQFESALAFMHSAVPERPLVVTEFSLVWAYQAHLRETLAVDAAGATFAKTFQRAPEQTVADYLSAAARETVAEEELHAFLASRSWFDPQSLEKCCELMERNGVTFATYAYLQASSGLERAGSRVGGGQPPWRLNPVFQERHARVPGGQRMAVNLGFFDTFVRRQSKAP